MTDIIYGHHRATLIIVAAVLMGIGFTLSTDRDVAAYSYSTGGRYGKEIDGDNWAYTFQSVAYGDWECSGPICSINISATTAYINIWYQSECFTCWYQEVWHMWDPYNYRTETTSINWWNTPWYNNQYSWGYADSLSGNQYVTASFGDDPEECSVIAWSRGLYWWTSIVRNSSNAYTYSYGH